jgi:copper resistance protein B
MTRRSLCSLFAMAAALAGSPALAQDHADHAGHAAPPEQPADPHAGHAGMDHAAPAAADPSPGPTMEMPPPPEAGSGPPRAADKIWGAEAMRKVRAKEVAMHGDFPVAWFQADRLELRVHEGADGYLWDLQGYIGGPTSKLWLKSEGEGAFGEPTEHAEVQALWSRAVAPFWDLQLGLRQDLAGPATSHAVIGVQGHAPYMFEVDAALFVSHRGHVTARIEAELDQRVTQRLILQPRVEASLSAQDIPQLGVGAGLDQVELGLRLRYEITRDFAPYVGVEQSWRTGAGARYARLAGEDPSVTSLVVGVRLQF